MLNMFFVFRIPSYIKDFKVNADEQLIIRAVCDKDCYSIAGFTWSLDVFDAGGSSTQVSMTSDKFTFGKTGHHKRTH